MMHDFVDRKTRSVRVSIVSTEHDHYAICVRVAVTVGQVIHAVHNVEELGEAAMEEVEKDIR